MSTTTCTLATCALNQWAMDFEGNLARVVESCRRAKEMGARYRVGPELELVGYGAEDHYLEVDTVTHALEMLGLLLKSGATDDLLVDVGLPMVHRDVRYNCRALCLNGRVLCIRPKQALAGDGNYREPRWFAKWSKPFETEPHELPDVVLVAPDAPRVVPFGDVVVQTLDATIGVESCEELFCPESPHVRMGLAGVDIIGNGSGSHHQLRKLDTRVNLIRNATSRNGGVYLYANQIGCDGGRLGFDGCALISVNGDVLAQGSQFRVCDVEVVTATLDLNAVRAYRCFSASRAVQAAEAKAMPRVCVEWRLCHERFKAPPPSVPIPVRYHSPEEEIAMGPAVWLWDYLRRSNATGYFLPLSGGADSSSTAAITYSMCRLVADAIRRGEAAALADAKRITLTDDVAKLTDAKFLANNILHTTYMGTSNSSEGTRSFARGLAEQIGNYHLAINMDSVVSAVISLFHSVTGLMPRYKVHGGHYAENQALQNIQARLRMVLAYLFAQLLPLVRRPGKGGFLLVLGSANVDEALRGYLTKYDCSAADVNPIGAISKTDLKKFLAWGSLPTGLDLPVLKGILDQAPTAELEPITETHTQTDEEDMGCTYAELSVFGRLRKIEFLGPVSMFRRWVALRPDLTPRAVADKVKFLWRNYSINRHKMTTLTPSYHAESYSPDDNRFDHRQFLYNVSWPWQFKQIDEEVDQMVA